MLRMEPKDPCMLGKHSAECYISNFMPHFKAMLYSDVMKKSRKTKCRDSRSEGVVR